MKDDTQNSIAILIQRLQQNHRVFLPSAYATAWVARVPKNADLKKPAFPAALDWLQEHPLGDGSWGTDAPKNPFANVLATLAVLAAFEQWNMNTPKIIGAAAQALNHLSEGLCDPRLKNFGFELVLTSLLSELDEQNVELPSDFRAACSAYLSIGQQQIEMLKGFWQQTQFQVPNVFFLCLELLGGKFCRNSTDSFPLPKDFVQEQSGLFCSVPATAFYLAAQRYRQADCPKADAFLTNLIEASLGGVPPYQPMEQYELVFALDFLIKGSVPFTSLQPLLAQLHQYWQQREGLGYSAYSPSLDADDTALGLIALSKAGFQVNPQVLRPFFNGSYFTHYPEDPTPSITVNANAARALQLFSEQPECAELLSKTLNWLRPALNSNLDQAFHDIWHLSPCYTASAAILALLDLDEVLAVRCIDWLLQKQQADGGWGFFGNSTLEETSLAALALVPAVQRQWIDRRKLAKTKAFLDKHREITQTQPSLYMGITMVYPELVVEATIYAAHYALKDL